MTHVKNMILVGFSMIFFGLQAFELSLAGANTDEETGISGAELISIRKPSLY